MQRKEHGEGEDQNGDEGNYARRGRGSAYPLGAGLAAETAITPDQRQHAAKDNRLEQPGHDLPESTVLERVLPIVVQVDAVDVNADEGAADDAGAVGKHRQ